MANFTLWRALELMAAMPLTHEPTRPDIGSRARALTNKSSGMSVRVV